MRTPVQTPSPTGLYWCQRGHIACAIHAPYEHSDTWNWDHWIPMTKADASGYRDMGFEARCECCDQKATP